jgi:hypothetical protein
VGSVLIVLVLFHRDQIVDADKQVNDCQYRKRDAEKRVENDIQNQVLKLMVLR